MTYYQLASVCSPLLPEHINVTFSEDNEKNFLSLSLARYLDDVKHLITEHADDWDNAKKMTNPYEYIHTVIPHGKHPISKLKPLSRAFYKMVEICNTLDILPSCVLKSINTFHLAEGPGGFIEAMTYLRHDIEDSYHGMTLIDTSNMNVPGWKKSDAFIKKHHQVTIEQGLDGTGDLYSPQNYTHCRGKYRNSMDIITGDGGFDFSVDFNNQESLALRLIFSQVAYALAMQAYGGTFILKFFDTFLKGSVDILYILSCFYTTVHIIKPHTSRLANSEKYVVCKGFRFHDTAKICDKFLSVLHLLNNMNIKDLRIAGFLGIPISKRYTSAVEEVNAILGQQQMENILATIRYIENKERKSDKFQQMKNRNIQKCVSWCARNKIPHNKTAPSGNMFMSSAGRRMNKKF
jgi:23S rRNA U2552 (ribose-2'-O)-methylase RlmE/FtsJ